MMMKSSVPTRGAAADPFQSLHRQINRLFDDMWGGAPATRATDWAPRCDVKETDAEIKIMADLPGIEDKDVSVTLDDDVLTIAGERKFEKEDKDKDYHLLERSYGSFSRALRLPPGVDPAKIQAEFAKGVLTVTVPKPREAPSEAKRIPIKNGP